MGGGGFLGTVSDVLVHHRVEAFLTLVQVRLSDIKKINQLDNYKQVYILYTYIDDSISVILIYNNKIRC